MKAFRFAISLLDKVGLKELWTFKWHRQFKTDGIWTKSGGVRASDWPEWIRRFKDWIIEQLLCFDKRRARDSKKITSLPAVK